MLELFRDDDEQEYWMERAAIFEFEDGQCRDAAERMAWFLLRARRNLLSDSDEGSAP